MSQPITPDTIEYERYVDGLRQQNTKMLNALRIAKSTLESFYRIQYAQGISKMADGPDNWVLKIVRAALPTNNQTVSQLAAAANTITIHIQGGMVQDVSGLPVGCELRVEDYDEIAPDHPGWDATKECLVTVFDGGAP